MIAFHSASAWCSLAWRESACRESAIGLPVQGEALTFYDDQAQAPAEGRCGGAIVDLLLLPANKRFLEWARAAQCKRAHELQWEEYVCDVVAVGERMLAMPNSEASDFLDRLQAFHEASEQADAALRFASVPMEPGKQIENMRGRVMEVTTEVVRRRMAGSMRACIEQALEAKADGGLCCQVKSDDWPAHGAVVLADLEALLSMTDVLEHPALQVALGA